jgi:putative DNA primase/helicase
MVRRTLVCDLNAEMERPELRKFDFDPFRFVLDNRGKCIAEVLILVRAFLTSGDQPEMLPIASYSDWSRVARAPLVWLGMPDPVLSMEAARADDPELTELRDIMGLWHRHIGMGVEAPAKNLTKIAELRVTDDTGRQLHEYTHPELHDALMAVAAGRNGVDGTKFGRWLGARKGRVVSLKVRGDVVERVRFEPAGATGGVSRWRLSRVKPKGE